MERQRGGGDRYGSNPESPHHFRNIRSSRSSDAPMNYPHRRSPNATNFRGGFSAGGANHRPFESPTRRPPSDGEFRPMDGSGFGSNHQAPLAGQKRGFPSSGLGGSPDHFDGGSFAKLFVGSVPRTVTEEDVRPLFEEHGNVLEVALIKDKRTGQQQGCCFIKFATSGEADRAIRALHNQYTLPGGAGPIQVRYADGERERLGAVEYKLFVGSLNKQASEKEVEEVFSPYGRVEDVYLMRDDLRQSRGCGFVKFSNRDMAMAAINALNGIYTMRGCDQPLTVRFADPKRPRAGESRGPAFGGPGFGPRFQPPPGVRPTPNLGDPMNGRVPPNAWHSTSPHSMGPSSNAGVHVFGNQLLPRSTDAANSLNLNGPVDASLPGAISSSQQNFSQSLPQVPSGGPQVSPSQKPIQSPQHLPPSLQQLHNQTPPSYSQTQPSYASLRPLGQRQIPHSVGQTSFSQGLQSQQLPGLSAHLSGSQSQVHQNASSATSQGTPLNINIQPIALPSPNQQQLPSPAHQQIPKPLQPVAQMISKQKQSLQASYQFSRQAFSELQQQYRQMQPTNQNLATQQNLQLQQMQPSNQSVATQPNSQLQQMQPSNQSLASQQMQPSNQSLATQQNSQLQPTNQSLTAQQNSHFQMQPSNQSQRPQQNSQLQQLQPSNQSLASQQSSQLQMQPSNQSLASQQISQFHQLQPSNQSPALLQSSQLQMQLPNQNLASQQTSQATKQQSQWGGVPSQTPVSTPAIDVLSTTSATAVPVATQVATPAKCDWTEHTSPDGYKYYHNSSTGESKWEKPEELMLYEQQQKHSAQPLQTQSQADSYPQGLSSQQVSQIPQTQLRPQGQVPQSHQPQSHFQGQVPQTLQTQSSHLQGLPTQQQVPQTPQHTQVPQTQQHTQVPQTQQHTQVPQTQQQTQSHLQNLSTQQQVPQTQQNQSYPQGPMQHVSQTQQAHLQNQHQTQMRHQQQQFQRPSPYQASGGMGHQNVQDFNYPHMQMGGNSVNDPGRFQQGFQPSQEWAWKNNKPAGA